jgi:hypothetical protein
MPKIKSLKLNEKNDYLSQLLPISIGEEKLFLTVFFLWINFIFAPRLDSGYATKSKN